MARQGSRPARRLIPSEAPTDEKVGKQIGVPYNGRIWFLLYWQIEELDVASPYDPPTTESVALPRPPIGDDVVTRLIDGTDTETLAFYDVSDCQIYGRKHRRKLTGALADAAESAGCEPVVYQTVLWWCLVYMPVVPLGTYFVMPSIECDDPDGDAEQYRGVRAQRDSSQIAVHYAVFFSLLSAIGLVIWWWLR